MVQRVPPHRRIRHRHRLEPFSYVYSGNRPGPLARIAFRVHQPVDGGTGYPQRTNRQLADCRTGGRPCHSRNDPSVMERANRMAVDILGHDRTRCAVLLLQFRVARKPALVSFVGI